MDLSYGAEAERFREEVRAFLEENRDRAPEGLGVMGGRSSEAMLAWQKLLIERGYAARAVPQAYGGAGAVPDILKDAVLAEEFARAGVPAGVSGPGVDLLVPTLLAHGSEGQKRRFVPPTVRGEMVWCQGYSEPGAGSDLASLRTAGVVDGDELVINGQKIWTSAAHVADMMFALVRTEPDAGKHAGISYVLIPMNTPGIDVQPLVSMTGEAEFNQVFLSDVRAPLSNIVGPRGGGWKIANTTLRHERQIAGNPRELESTLAALTRLLRKETRSGVRAIEDPLVRDRLMRLQARVLTLKFHAMRLLTCELRGEPAGVSELVVKFRACELMQRMAALAVDALGELGILTGGSKYARAQGHWQTEYMTWIGFIIAGGSAQIQKNIIAERGLGLPREPKRPRV